jgi:3-oxoacyl-[acyl-carrier protein] reductase
MTLTGKVAIVTGAGSGIGQAIAMALAAAGARVAVADHRAERASQVLGKIKDQNGSALAVEMDVSRPADCARLVQLAQAEWGAVDLLVANAGIQRRYPVHELPPGEFQAMLDVNLLGVFNCCQAVLPTFYSRGRGNIVIIASNSGKTGFATNAAYCASKFGVLGFMESLALESRPRGVRVNAICPAGVKTRMGDGLLEADGRPVDQAGFMAPEEIADVALFLASDQSRAIHGQSLNVYGGVDYRA